MSQDTSIEDREVEASRRLAAAVEPSTIYALLADAKRTGTPIDGGHYFVDVLAGIGIAVLSLAVVHALDLPRARGTRRLLGAVTQAFPASNRSLSEATRARS